MPFPSSIFVQTGQYTQVREIGSGAFGTVYYARDNLDREVAIKELQTGHPDYQEHRAKFEKEARLQREIDSPNVIKVFVLHVDPYTQEHYLVMEYANGGSLHHHLATYGRLEHQIAAKVILDICAALEKTWAAQIVHRDIKPGNILLIKDAQGNILAARLGDFGVAQDQKTRRTTVIKGQSQPGTPAYMPPEQHGTALVSVRADIFALGNTLYEALTARDTHQVECALHGDAHVEQTVVGFGRLGEVIRIACTQDQHLRFGNPTEMADAVRDALAGRPVHRSTSPTARATVPVTPLSSGMPTQPSARRGWLMPLATLLILVVVGTVWFSGLRDGGTVASGDLADPTATNEPVTAGNDGPSQVGPTARMAVVNDAGKGDVGQQPTPTATTAPPTAAQTLQPPTATPTVNQPPLTPTATTPPTSTATTPPTPTAPEPPPTPTIVTGPFIDTFDGAPRDEWTVVPPGVGTSGGFARPGALGAIIYDPPYDDYQMMTRVKANFFIYARAEVKDGKIAHSYRFSCDPQICEWLKVAPQLSPYPRLLQTERTFPADKLVDLTLEVRGSRISVTVDGTKYTMVDEAFTGGGVGIGSYPYYDVKLLASYDMVEVRPLP
jgi:serine/threonine-protein kinase